MKKIQRRLWAVAGSVFLLAACGGRNSVQAEAAYFDLGSATPKKALQAVPLQNVDVHAPSWLASSSMQYRLAYADSARRQAYGESRWAAPPAELLETYLRRGTAVEGTEAAGCRLRLDLDEFIQVFDSANESRAVIEGRVSLLAAQGNPVLARRVVSLSKATGSTDARGGVAAFSVLSGEMVGDLSAWLAKLAVESPKLVERCKG